MRKRGIVSKILGTAAVFAIIGVVLLGSPGIVDSVADPDAVDTVEVAAQAQSNCDCSATGSMDYQNPAAEYCAKMGYEYKTVKTEAGERGICVLPNGDEVDAWAFYRGECAPQFSYCARMGWSVAAEAQGDSYSDKCCTCSLPDGSQKTVSELLDLGPDNTVAVGTLIDKSSYEATATGMEGEPPESFDWRNKDGQNWMTPVKDQGQCGSCWAFATVGAVEPQYNIFANDSNIDLDLSEQHLVSCSGCGSCGGGGLSSALAFVRDEGIIDEACFPYTATDSPCENKCPDWSHRLYTIHAKGFVSGCITTIKEYLIEKGPLSAHIGVGAAVGGYFDENDIYRCADDGYTNHGVVIVGYDEAQDCWIAKNSWGTGWGDNGYFKVGCSECGIESGVLYAALNHAEQVIYQSHEIDDSAGGDGDGNAEPGESITMPVTLWNLAGNTTYLNVNSTLLVTSTTFVPNMTLLSEDFEGSWPGNWTVGDWNNYSGEDYWGQSDYRAYSGNFSAYCANVSDVSGQYYDDDMDAFMVRDVDISAYDLAILSYKYWLKSESGYDRLYAGYFDGSWHWDQYHTGSSSGWVSDNMEVPATATQVGFVFHSDGSITDEGAYIDDVVLTGGSYAPDPYINITDDSEEYGDISAGHMATSLDAYDFAIDPACPAGHVVIFTLNITASNGGPWTDSFTTTIVIPPQVSNVSGVQRSDGSGIVDIRYDVSGGGTVDVSVEYWDPSIGWDFCTYTAGDVGSGVTTGTGKAATWRAKTQLRRGYIPSCKVRVTATDDDGGRGSADSNTFLLDVAPPTISAKEPWGFAVSADSSIIITFSKPMDSSSTEGAFFISPAVNGSFHWTGNSMTFDPTAGLAGDTLYTVGVYGDATDSVGNGFDGNENGISEGSPADNYIWMFTTKAGGCFIATAAYGTPMAEEIQILRDFRDEYLLTNPAGQALVNLYYRVSPPIAEFITEHPGLKPIVRAGLAPAIAMSTIAVNTTTGQKVAIIGLVAVVSVAMVVWARRRRGGAPEYN